MENLEKRVEELELWQRDMDIRMSVAERDIDTMKENLNTIKDNTTWTLRWIIGGFTSAGIIVLGFILSGG